MEFEQLIQLIKTVSDSSLAEFKMEDEDIKLSMKTDKATKGIPMVVEAQPIAAVAPQAAPVAAAPAVAQTEESSAPAGNVVKAPLVGTFYASSSPEADAFVKVGDSVKKGQTLGIVEAMKLMNEIESEFEGTIVEILVENEQVVEYGQPMFVIA